MVRGGISPPAGSDPPATQQRIADGWGYAYVNPASIQADNGAGLTRGIIGLVNKGQPRKPDDWGTGTATPTANSGRIPADQPVPISQRYQNGVSFAHWVFSYLVCSN
jgi:hypothetical protein